jgi:type VI secretion system protein ImpJ
VSRFPEVHWSEGMFLRPQHFQMFSRQLGGMVADIWRRTQPFLWGFSELDVAEDALENFSFALRRCEGVLRDGTWVQAPTNLRLDPRDFKAALDASDGRLPVYLAVPLLREGEENTARPDGGGGAGGDDRNLRYRVEAVEAADENLGGAPRPVEIRKLSGRFLFGDESREGYETVQVALLQRAGFGSNAPALAADFIPPLLDVSVWPGLAQLAESILHRVEGKHRFLRAEVAEGRIVLDSEGTAGWQPVFKLQIVGGFLPILRQLTAVQGIHPFHLYLELSRLAGELSIFEEAGEAVSIPLYDHDQLGKCYRELAYTLERLLERILSGRFSRVDFELLGENLVARLKDEWVGRDAELYLCVTTDLSDRELITRLETAKIGTTADLPLLKQRRLFGLDIDLLKRTPGGLPTRENLHYFAIAKEGPYWDAVVRSREMAISGGIDPRLRFSLYIVLKPVLKPESGESSARRQI